MTIMYRTRRHSSLALVGIVTFFSLSFAFPVFSADQSGVAPFSLNELSWLAGRWQAKAFGGPVEETWDRPWDGSMIGTFKSVADGTPSFYEFMSITLDSTGSPVLRVKHFSPDFSGWEEKDQSTVFRFISAGDREISFDGISYRLLSDDSLRIIINLGHSEGESKETTIDCYKADK